MGPLVSTFTRAHVAWLAGVRTERVDVWERDGLIEPDTSRRISPHKTVRLYSYNNLLDVLIIAELEARQVSPRYLRRIVRHVREREYNLGQLTWAIAGSKVHFQAPDGSWEDGDRSQFVAAEVLDLRPLRERIKGSLGRKADTEGQVEKRRGTLGSKPVIAGTRVPVATIQRYLAAGFGRDKILAAFPNLSSEDIKAAQQFAS